MLGCVWCEFVYSFITNQTFPCKIPSSKTKISTLIAIPRWIGCTRLFLLTALVTSSLVGSTSAFFTDPHSPNASDHLWSFSRKQQIFFLFPLNERTVRFSPLSSRSLTPSSNTSSWTGFRCWFWPLILALTLTISSHHRRKLSGLKHPYERGGLKWDLGVNIVLAY